MTTGDEPDRARTPDDQLLEALLVGELTIDDPRVRQRMAEDEGFAREVADLTTLVGRLDGAGREERETLAEAAGGLPDPAFRRAAERLVGMDEPVRPKPHLRLLATAAAIAAAALVLILVGPFGGGSDSGGGDGPAPFEGVLLGHDFAVACEPAAEGASVNVRWDRDPGLGGWFRLRIVVAGADGAMREAATRDDVRASELSLERTWGPTESIHRIEVEHFVPSESDPVASGAWVSDSSSDS